MAGAQPEVIRFGEVMHAVQLTRTEGKPSSSCISLHEEHELKFGDCCVLNNLEVLEHDWQAWYGKSFVGEKVTSECSGKERLHEVAH